MGFLTKFFRNYEHDIIELLQNSKSYPDFCSKSPPWKELCEQVSRGKRLPGNALKALSIHPEFSVHLLLNQDFWVSFCPSKETLISVAERYALLETSETLRFWLYGLQNNASPVAKATLAIVPETLLKSFLHHGLWSEYVKNIDEPELFLWSKIENKQFFQCVLQYWDRNRFTNDTLLLGIFRHPDIYQKCQNSPLVSFNSIAKKLPLGWGDWQHMERIYCALSSRHPDLLQFRNMMRDRGIKGGASYLLDRFKTIYPNPINFKEELTDFIRKEHPDALDSTLKAAFP